ncbi:hypothetical protein J4H86_02300 [Spiractinospora alimapuensis]|uniref:hypothetical protein n=1 Tax=Spiractinospora alimapuensis TaxID=2820884 RepID=UPI001F1A0808|nr:hypothetical protein [Spiractinospora alimapuensis]QVQ52684.1 hypothetical protein J4H86_02300 [Spiractinospora alimapuensis]
MRNAATSGVLREHVDTATPPPEVTRVDYGREGHDLVVTVSMTPRPHRGEVAVVRDGDALLVVSTADGALVTTVPVDHAVRWDRLRVDATTEGLRMRAPFAGPRPLRVTPRTRPRGLWHRTRARVRRILARR